MHPSTSSWSWNAYGRRGPYMTEKSGDRPWQCARLAVGLTQSEVAARVGVTTGAIKRLERGLPASKPLQIAVALVVGGYDAAMELVDGS